MASKYFQCHDLDIGKERVQVDSLRFIGHAAYSSEGSHAIVWRSRARSGRTAGGTPCDGNFILLERTSKGYRELTRRYATWPHAACVADNGIHAVAIWEKVGSFLLRVIDREGNDLLDETLISAPLDSVAISADGRYAGVLCSSKNAAVEAGNFLLWNIGWERMVMRVRPLLACGHRIRIDTEHNHVSFLQYGKEDRAIVYDFEANLVDDTRFDLNDVALPYHLPMWHNYGQYTQDECWHLLNKMDAFRRGPGWKLCNSNARDTLYRYAGVLFDALGERRPAEWRRPVGEIRGEECDDTAIPIDPALTAHLDALVALGIHGPDRASVAANLLRAQITYLATHGLLPGVEPATESATR